MNENSARQRISEYPGRLYASGDEWTAMVARDSELPDHDPNKGPVTEHIENHALVLADSVAVEGERMVSGTRRVDCYATPADRETPRGQGPFAFPHGAVRDIRSMSSVDQLAARSDGLFDLVGCQHKEYCGAAD